MAEGGRTSTIIAWAVYGSLAVGVLSVLGSVLAILDGNFGAGATFLVAAALAFGLLAGAVLRQ